MKRLVAYLRVSTDGQVEHGFGLDIQRQSIEKWASREGHRIAVWAADEGVSGSNGFETREGLYNALEAVSAGLVDGLVVYSLDRLARKLTAQEAALAKVWDCGGLVYSVEQHGLIPEDDPDDPMRTAIRQMRGVFAQLERSMITKRLRDGKRVKAEAGGHLGGTAPFGYDVTDEGALVENATEQETLRRARLLRSEGHSLRAVCRLLDGEGRPPKGGGWWHHSRLSSALRRPAGAADRVSR